MTVILQRYHGWVRFMGIKRFRAAQQQVRLPAHNIKPRKNQPKSAPTSRS
jgi:hypothetical protein